MKVSELTGPLLDYWVAKAEGKKVRVVEEHGTGKRYVNLVGTCYPGYSPSTDWSQGGPIAAGERMDFNYMGGGEYEAYIHPARVSRGKSMLIAAMRCYVASKFGEDVPDE